MKNCFTQNSHCLLLALSLLSGCGLQDTAPRLSSSKDIGVVNTRDARTIVLYEEGDKVYLKTCKPPVAPPLTRDCPSNEAPKFLAMSVYLDKLPFDVAPYQKDQQGLSLVTKALQDAQNAVASGNQNAVATVERLEPIKLNLENLLKIRDNLKAAQHGLTYYEYQDEFEKLLVPFGVPTPRIAKFVKIPKGTFLMGSHSSEFGHVDNELQHSVTITYDFFMQTTEVTQEQWFEVMGNNPSKFSAEQDCPGEYKQVNGVKLCSNHPVERVSLNDVQLFIAKMNDKRDGFIYRLPTEAEWEYAARGGSIGPYSVAGNIADFAWFKGNAGNRTHAVAKLKPNAYGLYDVHGNVWEVIPERRWYFTDSHVTDPVGPSPRSDSIVRGGSFNDDEITCRSAFRGVWNVDSFYANVGFRLVRMPSP